MADEFVPVKRVGFTVTGKVNGVASRWDADRLEHAWLQDKSGHLIPALSFMSSGHRTTVPAADVDSVEFHKPTVMEYDGKKYFSGISHCASCDGPINFVVPRPE